MSNSLYKPRITALRGIAALLVCFYHFLHTPLEGEFLMGSDSFAFYVSEWGQYGVHLFFLISAFIIPYTLHNKNYERGAFWRFMGRRIIRLEIPYWATILGIFAVAYAYSIKDDIPFPDITFAGLSGHIFYITEFIGEQWYSPVFWSLAIEFQLYLFLGLIFPLLFKSEWKMFLSGIATLTALGFLNSSDLLTAHWFTHFIWIFNIGFILAYSHIHNKMNYAMSGLILLNLVLCGLRFHHGDGFEPAVPILLIFGLFAIVSKDKEIPGLEFLGKISYSLYLTHGITGLQFLYSSHDFGWSPMLRLLLALVISIGGAALMYYIVEQPAMRLARRLRYK